MVSRKVASSVLGSYTAGCLMNSVKTKQETAAGDRSKPAFPDSQTADQALRCTPQVLAG